MNPTIAVVGSYGVGLTLRCERAPEAGETVTGESFSSGPGGKGSNQAIALARLGADVTLCTVVGDDDFGTSARALWKHEGVRTDLVHTHPGSTMVGVIIVEAGGENRIAIAPGVLESFTADDLRGLSGALAAASVLLVGLEIPTGTAHHALRIGRDAGVTTILNPAPAPSTPLDPGLLQLVDHLTPNRSEAARLAGYDLDADPRDLLAAPCFDAVTTMVLTLGSAGALVRHDQTITAIEPVHVSSVVDTTGAGDAFNAAYALRVAAGDHPVDAARFATKAAAFSVTRAEVVPSLPTAVELQTWTDLTLAPPAPRADHQETR